MNETCAHCGKTVVPNGWVAERQLVRYATPAGPVVLCSPGCDHAWAEQRRTGP